MLWAVLEVEFVVNLNCPYQKVRLLIGTAIADYLSRLCLVWLVRPCAWLLCLFSQFWLNSTSSWAELMLPTVWPRWELDGTEMCLSWAQAWHVNGFTLNGGGFDAAHFIHGLVKGGYSTFYSYLLFFPFWSLKLELSLFFNQAQLQAEFILLN